MGLNYILTKIKNPQNMEVDKQPNAAKPEPLVKQIAKLTQSVVAILSSGQASKFEFLLKAEAQLKSLLELYN